MRWSGVDLDQATYAVGDMSLAELVMRGVITFDTALAASSRPEQLRGQLERLGYRLPDEEAAAPTPIGGLRVAGS